MLTPTLNYIESDFTSATETIVEYRLRTAMPRKQRRLRRLLALA
jgi:hypothetical protein